MVGHLPGDPYWAEPEGSYREAARPPAKPLRVAYTTAGTEVDSEIKAAVDEAVRLIERHGHQDISRDCAELHGFSLDDD